MVRKFRINDGMTTVIQKTILALTLLSVFVLAVFVTTKKFTLDSHRHDVLMEMVANISSDLDKLENGFDTIAARTEVAKRQIRRIAAVHRENIIICALLRERHSKKETKLVQN